VARQPTSSIAHAQAQKPANSSPPHTSSQQKLARATTIPVKTKISVAAHRKTLMRHYTKQPSLDSTPARRFHNPFRSPVLYCHSAEQ